MNKFVCIRVFQAFKRHNNMASFGNASGTFKFCFIPSEDLANMVEMERSISGGLEKDELQVAAKAHFKDDRDGEARYQAVKQAYADQGKDFSQADPTMVANLASMGANVEITTLGVACQENGFLGVSLYCDGNGEAKRLPLNKRATDIARACGHAGLVVRGDAFLSRCYDNEPAGDPWVRRSLGLEECSVTSPWVVASRAANEKRNMAAYTSSGATASNLQNLLGTNVRSIVAGEQGSTNAKPGSTDGALTWTQAEDEVEVAIQVPAGTEKNHVNVQFKVNNIHLSVAGLASDGSELLEGLLTGQGCDLAGKVVPDESTWCLSREGGGPILQVTLVKADSSTWQSLFK